MNTGRHVDVQTDARGITYVTGADGQPVYLMPSNGGYNPQTHQIEKSPNTPHSGLLSDYQWDPKTGTFDRTTNWGNVVGLGTLAAIATPFAMSALGSAGAASATTGGAAMNAQVDGLMAGAGGGAGTAGGGSMAGFGSGVLGKVFDTRGGVAAIQGGLGLLGSKMQANSSDHAAAVEAKAAADALAFAKEQYAKAEAQFAPYLQAGQGALARMQDLASQSELARTGYGPQTPMLPPRPAAPTLSTPGGPVGQSGAMVTLRAPNGQTKQVPANQAQHYIAQGAQQVA